jgi:hypothetical protein
MVMTITHKPNVEVNKEEIAPGVFVYRDVIVGHSQLIPYIEQVVYAGQHSWEDKNIAGNQLDTMTFEYPVEFKDPNEPSVTFAQRIGLVLAGFFGIVENDYMSLLSKPITMHEKFLLSRQSSGTKFGPGYEDQGSMLSVLYYLNDDYSGGLVEWPELGVSYQPKANELIIFPSAPDFKYSITEIMSGVKYSVLSYVR